MCAIAFPEIKKHVSRISIPSHIDLAIRAKLENKNLKNLIFYFFVHSNSHNHESGLRACFDNMQEISCGWARFWKYEVMMIKS